MRPNALQVEINRLSQAITDLGAVNMAALEELEAGRERKGFLDAQATDLNMALETLEAAIRRIDRETREMLQQTFDSVNGHFGEMFPSLFGGGEARLVMTGEEILDAGVQVIAQPPGKKTSTIHLLSGGEKTRLALALLVVSGANVLLLDEPTNNLDPASREEVLGALKAFAGAIVLVTHDEGAVEALSPERVIVLPDGVEDAWSEDFADLVALA